MDLATFPAAASEALPGDTAAKARRAAAYERAAAREMPTDADELWRYSRIAELDLADFHPVAAGEVEVPEPLPADVEAVLAAIGPRAALVVTAGGRTVRSEAGSGSEAAGLSVGGLDALHAIAEELAAAEGELTHSSGADVFADLHDAFAPDAVFVDVARGAAVADPVVVLHWADGAGTAAFPRTVVRTGEQAEVTVIEVLASPHGVRALVVPSLELHAGAASTLRHVTVQGWGDATWQLAHVAVRNGRDSTVDASIVALGAAYARTRVGGELIGDGSSAGLRAAYVTDGDRVHDFRVLQGHVGRATRSDLFFKGAVDDRAHAVYSGVIRVDKGAKGTNGFQTIRNLVLSDEAWADAVPNLEIIEQDVACSHATTVGPIDDSQRFYLESRGVPSDVAERLIVQGFFAEVIEQLPVPGLRLWAGAAIAARVGAAS